MKSLLTYLLISFSIYSCNQKETAMLNPVPENIPEEQTPETTDTTKLSYLALGDSYTIGESVKVKERWPVILADSLINRAYDLGEPKIIARTGWTTDELQVAIKGEKITDTFSIASLLIGVNNQYRGYAIAQYEKEFKELLQTAIEFAGNDASKVFVVSIPDYSATPFAASSDKEKIAKEIDEYNQIAETICNKYQIKYFNITPISREADYDTSLVADDGLHPSGAMYNKWVKLFLDDVVDIIESN
ncbi:SGNH/GDSL hydrolase family protein [Chondrinema litorale]|uniref:SGNH/GDSL hydrolase family protein n=1 Tax=Chondrinema litorale TaxID=2994555 RepID=UPI002543459A|nr:SGNH/GDSL hydrolase family protein [Chondrinema litorale]UZR94919.1 SGNH/GDSL hydrolase family protein [Chondrinema litorale]